MRTAVIVVMGACALLLGIDKVRNEHRMTEMYARQADALDRIAAAAESVACGQTGVVGYSSGLVEIDCKKLPAKIAPAPRPKPRKLSKQECALDNLLSDYLTNRGDCNADARGRCPDNPLYGQPAPDGCRQ